MKMNYTVLVYFSLFIFDYSFPIQDYVKTLQFITQETSRIVLIEMFGKLSKYLNCEKLKDKSYDKTEMSFDILLTIVMHKRKSYCQAPITFVH